MLDVSFSEILVIAVVALIVIGPEKLPKVARTLGLLAGRLQRYVGTVKAEIEREMRLDELRKMKQDAHQMGNAVQTEMMRETRQVGETLDSAANATEPAKPHPDKPAA